jgi:hypothetical protein
MIDSALSGGILSARFARPGWQLLIAGATGAWSALIVTAMLGVIAFTVVVDPFPGPSDLFVLGGLI